MFCKPPHPVYIVLFRGDDTDFVGNQEIIVKITTERDISGCKAYFKYMGNIQTFDEIPENKELHLVFSSEQTKEMPLGTWDAELYLIDENGKRMTVNNRIHMLVTNSVREAYFPDDPQAVSVVISANKYIEDAEVSADGKTLTLTKKDGTEVSFSCGGGGTGPEGSVPITEIAELPPRYRELDMRNKINEIVRIISGQAVLLSVVLAPFALIGAGVNVYTAQKDQVWNDDSIVTNVTFDAEGLATKADVESKADTSELEAHVWNYENPHEVTAEQTGAVPLVGDVNGKKTAVTIGTRLGTVGPYSLANGNNVTASGQGSHAEGLETVASGVYSHANGMFTEAFGPGSYAGGYMTKTLPSHRHAFVWSGHGAATVKYLSKGEGTFNINPIGGVNGFYIGEKKLSEAISDGVAGKADTTNVYTKAEVDAKVDAVDNKADEAYSSAEQMVDAVNSLAGTIGTHIRDTKNPHKVTAAQVGAATPADVTAAIREHSLGGIWDADLQVWWTPVMSNGKLTYQATTNVNLNTEH